MERLGILLTDNYVCVWYVSRMITFLFYFMHIYFATYDNCRYLTFQKTIALKGHVAKFHSGEKLLSFTQF